MCVSDGSGARGAEAGDQASGDGPHALAAGERVSDQQPAGGATRARESATAGQDRAGGDHGRGRGGDHGAESETHAEYTLLNQNSSQILFQ